MTTNNTIAQKAARRKLNLLQLANDLGNVSVQAIPENNSMRYEPHAKLSTNQELKILDSRQGKNGSHKNKRNFCVSLNVKRLR